MNESRLEQHSNQFRFAKVAHFVERYPEFMLEETERVIVNLFKVNLCNLRCHQFGGTCVEERVKRMFVDMLLMNEMQILRKEVFVIEELNKFRTVFGM